MTASANGMRSRASACPVLVVVERMRGRWGVGFLQPPRKGNAGKRLADTHSMNPDRARGMRGQLVERGKSEPQAFAKVRDILSVA